MGYESELVYEINVNFQIKCAQNVRTTTRLAERGLKPHKPASGPKLTVATEERA